MLSKKLVKFIEENGTITDRADLHTMQTTEDARLKRMIAKRLKQHYEPDYEQEEREKFFDSIF